MSEKARKQRQGGIKRDLLKTVKGKFLMMGIMGIAVALVLGLIGMTSINQNAKSSDVVTLVSEINLLQTENTANDTFISQENAASAETTSNAMEELNEETVRLADTSAKLQQIADNLKGELDFFRV